MMIVLTSLFLLIDIIFFRKKESELGKNKLSKKKLTSMNINVTLVNVADATQFESQFLDS